MGMEHDEVFTVFALFIVDEESEIRQRTCVNVALVPHFHFGFPVPSCKETSEFYTFEGFSSSFRINMEKNKLGSLIKMEIYNLKLEKITLAFRVSERHTVSLTCWCKKLAFFVFVKYVIN